MLYIHVFMKRIKIIIIIISPLENREKKKCSLAYLVVVLLYNSFNYSVLKFCRNKKMI